MIADPAPREDGICALSGCRRRVPDLAIQRRDPFHSAACARTFNGLPPLERINARGVPATNWGGRRSNSPRKRRDMIVTLRSVVDRLGYTPTMADWKVFGKPSYSTVIKEFGSWGGFLRAGGFTPRDRWETARMRNEQIEHPRAYSNPALRT